jgi:hypothetical protein
MPGKGFSFWIDVLFPTEKEELEFSSPTKVRGEPSRSSTSVSDPQFMKYLTDGL